MSEVIAMTWTEYERGWGPRPDGASLHSSQEDMNSFIKEYWARQPKGVPDEYSKEDGVPVYLDVPEELFEQVKISKNGIWISQTEWYTLRKNKVQVTKLI